MTKRLKPYTIVPHELYVEREADRQVAEIISHMGRPGYVLVARQMGKTNLLLNAKRELGGHPDVFLYLDVSNCFPDIKSFFRNIVDVALETDDELDIKLHHRILDRRNNYNYLPHKEHEWELREILRSIPGKLIICLDEIDALASSSYSDQVFSFIRSVYFSGRSNFPEFSRMTYLLSGVAEPTDIIKNKDVSPFNIGEKIYLDDFTTKEFRDFCNRSGVSGSSNAIDRIFYWTNGHPRMTWDVCSEIEEQKSYINKINTIDEAVKKLYFSEVDRPPVDHIRQLVSSNRDIRDAIISMHYGRTTSISDSLKTKLYLGGVSSYNLDSKEVTFKNRILEEALSESYLYKLESSDSFANLDSCVKRAESQDYESALPGLLIIISDSVDTSKKAVASYWAGVCYFWLDKYEEALKYFSDDVEAIDRQQAILKSFYRGVALWMLKRFQSAEIYLDYVIRNESHEFPWLHIEAIAYLSYLILADDKSRPQKVVELCISALEKFNNITQSKKITLDSSQLRAFISSNLSKAYRSLGKMDLAVSILDDGIKNCCDISKAGLIIEHLEFDDISNREIHLKEAVDAILITREFESNFYYSKNALSFSQCQIVIARLNSINRHQDITRVATHVFASVPKNISLIGIIAEMCSLQGNISNRLLGVKLIGIALDASSDSFSVEDFRELWRFIFYVDVTSGVKTYGKPYIESFAKRPEDMVSHADIRFLYLLGTDYRSDIGESSADAAIQILQRKLENETSISAIEIESFSILQEYVLTKRSLEKGEVAQIAARVRSLRKRLYYITEFQLYLFPKDFLLQMRVVLLALMRANKLFTETRETRKIGRNDIVQVSYGGEIKSGKYKKFIDDIDSGLCNLLI